MMIYEVDHRHAEITASEIVVEHSKIFSSPAVRSEPTPEVDEALYLARSTSFRSIAARANHLALGGLDVQYACKEVSPAMASPKEVDGNKLTRLATYLKGGPRLAHRYWRTRGENMMKV